MITIWTFLLLVILIWQITVAIEEKNITEISPWLLIVIYCSLK